jgi:hypothetical protein
MQLQHVVANESVTPPRAPQTVLTTATEPAHALAEVGVAAAGLGGEILGVARRQQHIQAMAESYKILSDLEVATSEGLLRIGHETTDPVQYMSSAIEHIEDLGATIPTRTTNPLVQQYLTQRWAHLRGQALLKAVATRDALWTDHQKALGEATEDQFARAIASQRYTDRVKIEGLTQDAFDSIEGGRTIFGDSKTVERKQRFADRVNNLVATTHVQQNPDDFLAGGIDAYVLKPEDRTRLSRAAETRSQYLTNLDDKHAKRVEHEQAIARTDAYAAFGELLFGRPGGPGRAAVPGITEEQMRADPSWSLLDEPQREHLISMVRDPKQAPSDQAVVASVVNRLGDRPTITEDEIKRMPGLNNADRLHYATAVRERVDYWRGIARADRHRDEDQALADLHRRHEEVNREAIGVLTINGSSSPTISENQAKYQAVFRDAMLTRSKSSGRPLPGFPRTEEPEKVMRDVLPTLTSALRNDAGKAFDRASRAISESRFPTETALFAKYPGDPSQYANVQEYKDALRRFRDRDQLKRNYDALTADLERLGVGVK